MKIKELKDIAEDISRIAGKEYFIQSAYGGHKLVMQYKNTTGIQDISEGYITKKELYIFCVAFRKGMHYFLYSFQTD